MPARLLPLVAPGGDLILAAAYLGLSASLVTGHPAGALLIVLLGLGGFGLGAGFSGLIAHLAAAAPPRYAPDLSGLITTISQLAAVVGVAAVGTIYLSLAPYPGPHPAMHAFTIVTAIFALTALLAAAAAYRATHRSSTTGDVSAVSVHPDAAERRQTDTAHLVQERYTP